MLFAVVVVDSFQCIQSHFILSHPPLIYDTRLLAFKLKKTGLKTVVFRLENTNEVIINLKQKRMLRIDGTLSRDLHDRHLINIFF